MTKTKIVKNICGKYCDKGRTTNRRYAVEQNKIEAAKTNSENRNVWTLRERMSDKLAENCGNILNEHTFWEGKKTITKLICSTLKCCILYFHMTWRTRIYKNSFRAGLLLALMSMVQSSCTTVILIVLSSSHLFYFAFYIFILFSAFFSFSVLKSHNHSIYS